MIPRQCSGIARFHNPREQACRFGSRSWAHEEGKCEGIKGMAFKVPLIHFATGIEQEFSLNGSSRPSLMQIHDSPVSEDRHHSHTQHLRAEDEETVDIQTRRGTFGRVLPVRCQRRLIPARPKFRFGLIVLFDLDVVCVHGEPLRESGIHAVDESEEARVVAFVRFHGNIVGKDVGVGHGSHVLDELRPSEGSCVDAMVSQHTWEALLRTYTYIFPRD